jgi:hypothetical protein
MKKVISILILVLHCVILNAEQQDNAVAPPRTPEQEAFLQTNKMQQELGLSAEQSKVIYEINLRHARERQTSTSRSEALKRVKNKDQELQRALTPAQYDRLQEKRFDENPAQIPVSSIINGRTRTITNPQLIESGRVVAPESAARSSSRSSSESIRIESTGRTSNPTTNRNAIPGNNSASTQQRGTTTGTREASPATQQTTLPRGTTPTNETRRTIPEGTHYVPPRQTTIPATSRQETMSRPASTSTGGTSSGGSRSSSGSASSGARR